jgi:hypothetical protein
MKRVFMKVKIHISSERMRFFPRKSTIIHKIQFSSFAKNAIYSKIQVNRKQQIAL